MSRNNSNGGGRPPRLNDTAALAHRPLEVGVQHSVSTRKVGEGFVTRTESYNPSTGSCKTAEFISKTPPKVIAPYVEPGPTDAVGSKGLADAIAWMGQH